MQTKASFNDSVDVSIQFINGQNKIVALPIINNNFSYKILVTENPQSILIDPNVKFIKLKNGEPWIIKKVP